MSRDAIRMTTTEGRLTLIPERDGAYSVLRGTEHLGRVEPGPDEVQLRLREFGRPWRYVQARDGFTCHFMYRSERYAAKGLAVNLRLTDPLAAY